MTRVFIPLACLLVVVGLISVLAHPAGAIPNERAICVTAERQDSADIHGDRIVWMDDRNGNFDIYMKDLRTGVESPICTDAATQYRPAIHGR